jgi:hypothetical protein
MLVYFGDLFDDA